MLTESFIISTKGSKSSGQNATKSDGIQLHEYRPQSTLRRLYKNSSTNTHCLGVSRMHLFAAQAEKSTVHVYNRVTGKQEATVAFQRKITALAVTSTTFPIIILGTDDGSLVFWEVCELFFDVLFANRSQVLYWTSNFNSCSSSSNNYLPSLNSEQFTGTVWSG